MSLLRVESHEISGGLDEPRKVRIVLSDGRSGTYDYPEYLSGLDAHEHCITRLMDRATWERIDSFYKVGETSTGHRWTIFLRAEATG